MEHSETGSCQKAKEDVGKPVVRFLARSNRRTRSMPAWLIGETRQRRRRFCASGWEATKEGAAVWWRSPNDRVPGNKTERQTVSSPRWEQEATALLFRRSKALPNRRSVPMTALSRLSSNFNFILMYSDAMYGQCNEEGVWLNNTLRACL